MNNLDATSEVFCPDHGHALPVEGYCDDCPHCLDVRFDGRKLVVICDFPRGQRQ